MGPIKVLIADDHKDFRKVVHSFLNSLPNIIVVGEAVDGIDVVQKTESLDPDVVLMDISMPNRNGLDAARIIKSRWPDKKVVITTLSDDPVYRSRAQEVQADNFILKSSLKPGLEAALTGSAFLPPAPHSPGSVHFPFPHSPLK